MVADVAVSVVMTEVVVLEAMVVVVIVVVVVAVVVSAAIAAETGLAEAMPAKVCRRGERVGDLFPPCHPQQVRLAVPLPNFRGSLCRR